MTKVYLSPKNLSRANSFLLKTFFLCIAHVSSFLNYSLAILGLMRSNWFAHWLSLTVIICQQLKTRKYYLSAFMILIPMLLLKSKDNLNVHALTNLLIHFLWLFFVCTLFWLIFLLRILCFLFSRCLLFSLLRTSFGFFEIWFIFWFLLKLSFLNIFIKIELKWKDYICCLMSPCSIRFF